MVLGLGLILLSHYKPQAQQHTVVAVEDRTSTCTQYALTIYCFAWFGLPQGGFHEHHQQAQGRSNAGAPMSGLMSQNSHPRGRERL